MKELVPVRVKTKIIERKELKPIETIPDDYQYKPIPNRWKV